MYKLFKIYGFFSYPNNNAFFGFKDEFEGEKDNGFEGKMGEE